MAKVNRNLDLLENARPKVEDMDRACFGCKRVVRRHAPDRVDIWDHEHGGLAIVAAMHERCLMRMEAVCKP